MALLRAKDRSASPIRLRTGVAALGRRRDGVAVGLRIFTCSASLQPGIGGGVGGKGRWTAVAVPPQTESAKAAAKCASAQPPPQCQPPSCWPEVYRFTGTVQYTNTKYGTHESILGDFKKTTVTCVLCCLPCMS